MSVDYSAVLGYGWLIYDKTMIDVIDDALWGHEESPNIVFESINVYDENAPFFFGVSLATSRIGAVVVDEVEESSTNLADCIALLENKGLLDIMDALMTSPGPQVYLIQECW